MACEFDGRKYGEASSHQREWGARLIEELALEGTESVLDLGCGEGSLTARVAGLVPRGRVVGIDASRGMIDAALPKAGGNLRFALMDIDDLDFDGQFDVVFSNAALHWVHDHRRLLRNARRALRPGGVLRFNFGGEGNCAAFLDVVREVMAREEFAGPFAAFPWPWYMPGVEEYRSLVASSPLRDARVWGERADRLFPDEESLVRWIDQPSLVPFLAALPEEAKAPFRQRVVAGMIDRTRGEDGRCFETFRRVNLFARR